MKIELPPLPYGDADLAPHISANTISFHYGKHHKTYVDKAKGMVEGTEFADAELEDIVKATYGKADKKGLFNNAAQAWNHAFYWRSMQPGGGGDPTDQLLKQVKADFGALVWHWLDCAAVPWVGGHLGEIPAWFFWLRQSEVAVKLAQCVPGQRPALGSVKESRLGSFKCVVGDAP